MNYRHAFHAGNAADVLKHAVLARVLAWLGRKPAPLRVIDTHAGAGLYDLASREATRSPEWRDGIARIEDGDGLPDALAVFLKPYLAALAGVRARWGENAYPGSPLVAREMLRPDDRLVCCEISGDAAGSLRAALGRDRRVRVLEIDGYNGWKAQIPPPERRGVVLVDPPFEAADEFARVLAGLKEAARRWPTGTQLVWYPAKDPALVGRFLDAVAELPLAETLRLELHVAAPGSRPGLTGSGLLVVNPPWTLLAEAEAALPSLAGRLALGRGACGIVETVVPESA
jgi:23S rRNA (adenine2030-N6)-methyltransferase